jgi:hypothetical protein
MFKRSAGFIVVVAVVVLVILLAGCGSTKTVTKTVTKDVLPAACGQPLNAAIQAEVVTYNALLTDLFAGGVTRADLDAEKAASDAFDAAVTACNGTTFSSPNNSTTPSTTPGVAA